MPESEHNTKLFWWFQILGWLAFSSFSAVTGLLYGRDWLYLAPAFIYAPVGMLLTWPLRWLFRVFWEKPLALQVTIAALASSTVAVAFAIARIYIYTRFFPESMAEVTDWREYLWEIVFTLYVMIAWSTLYFGVKYYRMSKQQKDRVLKAKAIAHQAQLKMLRYQLNPHFLFNTLNAISTLILSERNENANRMLSRLSAFLRYSLDSDPMQKVTLKQELDALNLYLNIEKLRFDSRLHLQFDVSQQASQMRVPSLILQPLIENAIKYAIAPKEDGGTIRIAAEVEFDQRLKIVVEDDGPGVDLESIKTHADGRGVGLANVRERLRVLYGDGQSFELNNAQPHGLRVTMRIPSEHD